jgi:hypothetical protein
MEGMGQLGSSALAAPALPARKRISNASRAFVPKSTLATACRRRFVAAASGRVRTWRWGTTRGILYAHWGASVRLARVPALAGRVVGVGQWKTNGRRSVAGLKLLPTVSASASSASPSSTSPPLPPPLTLNAVGVVAVAPPKGPGSAAAALQDADSVEEVLAAADLLVRFVEECTASISSMHQSALYSHSSCLGVQG